MQDSARIRSGSVLYERIINFFKLYNAIIVYSALIILYDIRVLMFSHDHCTNFNKIFTRGIGKE